MLVEMIQENVSVSKYIVIARHSERGKLWLEYMNALQRQKAKHIGSL